MAYTWYELAFLIAGALTVLRVGTGFLLSLYSGLRCFVLPKLGLGTNLRRKFGKWAGKSGGGAVKSPNARSFLPSRYRRNGRHWQSVRDEPRQSRHQRRSRQPKPEETRRRCRRNRSGAPENQNARRLRRFQRAIAVALRPNRIANRRSRYRHSRQQRRSRLRLSGLFSRAVTGENVAAHDRQHGFGHVNDPRVIASIDLAEAWPHHQRFVLFRHASTAPARRLFSSESVC